jgi:hypothetical protein
MYYRVVKYMLTYVSEVRTASIIRALSEPRKRITGYIGVQVDCPDQWEMGDDRLVRGRFIVEEREVLCGNLDDASKCGGVVTDLTGA